MLINAGSVDDIRSSLRSSGSDYSIMELWKNVMAEKKGRKRSSVINMICSAIRSKWKRLSGAELFSNYPKWDHDRQLYVRYPVLNKRGKWEAVNVLLPTGYSNLVAPTQFDTQEQCAKACDMENRLCGFSTAQVLEIIAESMGVNSK